MKKIEIWLDDTTVDTIDQRRGLAPRSAYTRNLIESVLDERSILAGAIPPSLTKGLPKADPTHRHRYDKTGDTRPKGNGRGVEHLKKCDDPFCGDEKWEA